MCSMSLSTCRTYLLIIYMIKNTYIGLNYLCVTLDVV